MARFYPLTVTDIQKTIRDAVVVSLSPDPKANFDFIQGQYLTFKKDFNGQEIRRSYSICSGLDDPVLQVGIKHVADGAFSTWANSDLAVGDVLHAMPPQGRFFAPLDAEAENHYLGFAGGSGITPLLSIIRTTLAREPRSRFTLLYANRRISSIMFREELEDLKNIYMDRLSVLHILEDDPQEIDLFSGRITSEKLDMVFANWISLPKIACTFICGPEPMMTLIAARLSHHGMPQEKIKYELFKSDQPGRLALKTKTNASDQKQATTRVTITIDGASSSFEMRRDQSILQAALEHNLDAPFSCQAGVCSTCLCKVVEGDIEMIANHALQDDEITKGYALSCQSYPLSDHLVIQYDQ